VPATAIFVLFAGIYYGAMYGGSTTSILLNTPGESATIVTSLEGNKMARRGRAGPALATAAIGSFVAGTIGTIALTFYVQHDWDYTEILRGVPRLNTQALGWTGPLKRPSDKKPPRKNSLKGTAQFSY
jgi:TctA family transporter